MTTPPTFLSHAAQARLSDVEPPPSADFSDPAVLAAVRDGVEEEWTAFADAVPHEFANRVEHLGDVRAVRFARSDDTLDRDEVIVYVHGGSFLFGSPESTASVAIPVAVHSGLPVVSVDYPLSPEARCPAAIETVVAAVHELNKSARVIGLFGDSAGGGIALAAAVALTERGMSPDRLGLIAPWVDLTCSGDSYQTMIGVGLDFPDPNLPPIIASLYSEDPGSSDASPLFADLTGLGPTLIQVGGREILLSDATRLARALREHGVDTRLDVWDGLWHVWHQDPSIPEADDALTEMANFLAGPDTP